MILLDKLYDTFGKNWRGKKVLFFLLKTPLVTKNLFYKKLYLKNVRRQIKNLVNKPEFVIIENTNFCNISCVFCANSQMKRTKGFIRKELFEKIIKDCVEQNINNIIIQGYGEPLLDKDYVAKVNFAKEQGIKHVQCVTNGILLNEEVSRGLIKAQLDSINISIDAASEETYRNIHKDSSGKESSDKFKTILKNIDQLIKIRKFYNSKKPHIQLRFKDFELNKGELKNFIQAYTGCVDEINIYMNITNWPGSTVNNNLPKGIPMIKFPCRNLWSTLFITHDGRAALCCQDYECQVELGNLNNETIMDVWRSERLRAIRQTHLQDKFDSVSVCRDCVVNTHYVSPWWLNSNV